VHKDAMAELITVREELQAVEADIEKLQELDNLVRAGPRTPAPERPITPERPIAKDTPPAAQPRARGTPAPIDELAFIKSVTDDDKGNSPSPKRASGSDAAEGAARTTTAACTRGDGTTLGAAASAAIATSAVSKPAMLSKIWRNRPAIRASLKGQRTAARMSPSGEQIIRRPKAARVREQG
jgi:hypothetical protein